MIYLRQLESLLIHRVYVFLAGLLIGVPLWRLVIHPMPETYVREMIADMQATSKQATGSWDIATWLNQNGPEMHLHDETVTLINKGMKEAGYILTDNDWSWIAGRKVENL